MYNRTRTKPRILCSKNWVCVALMSRYIAVSTRTNKFPVTSLLEFACVYVYCIYVHFQIDAHHDSFAVIVDTDFIVHVCVTALYACPALGHGWHYSGSPISTHWANIYRQTRDRACQKSVAKIMRTVHTAPHVVRQTFSDPRGMHTLKLANHNNKMGRHSTALQRCTNRALTPTHIHTYTKKKTLTHAVCAMPS